MKASLRDGARKRTGSSIMKNPLYRIQWRPQAREDLRAIVRYVGKDHPMRAAGFGQMLRDKTRLLVQYPNMGRTGRPGIPAFVRELIAHRHDIVLYRVWDETKTVEILRVKHTARRTP